MSRFAYWSQGKKVVLAAFAVVTLGVTTGAMQFAYQQQASALSGSQFNAGHIIDDVVFTNKSAMSVSDIQNFLNAKVPSCDTNGALSKSYYYNSSTGRVNNSADTWVTTTRAVYAQRYDSWNNTSIAATPYVCLKDYVENPTTFANNLNNPGASIGGGLSAAQLIYNAAQTYSINPEVLLVTIQKEQGLVTDDWPWTTEFTEATGSNCPDSGGCAPTSSGFYKQVNGAAAQFRYYLDHPNAYNYWIGNYYVLYNPNTNCGGSVINIQNAATAALYIYTPYQPNAAALNNLTGSGDSCSSYGNRNFWYYFNTWFGTSLAPTYAYQVLDQYVYSDQTKTVGTNLFNKFPGDRVWVGVKVENLSNQIWSNSSSHPVHLGTTDGQNSPYCDPTWLGCNRPANMIESTVSPGQTATFEFWMDAPQGAGNYDAQFNLVMEGASWFPSTGLNFATSVLPEIMTWQVVAQYAYTDQTKTVGKATTGLVSGDRVYVGLKVRNTGNMTWNQSGHDTVRLGTVNPTDRTSAFYDSSWVLPTRPAALQETSVAPGQIGTFEFWIKASQAGSFAEYFAPVMEAVAWAPNIGFNFYNQVNPAVYSWQLQTQYAYTDQTKTTGKGTVGLNPGDRVYVGFTAKNTGNVTWYNNGPNPVNVGMTHPLDRLSPFFDNTWLGQNRPAHMLTASVAPGQIGVFEFWMDAPSTPGTYLEYFDLVAEGLAWMPDQNMNFYMTVN